MKKPKIVYFVRHGQSDDNAAPIFQAYDSPLSVRGKHQAMALAERLKHLEFDVLISSPQLRAKQTAEYIAKATDKKIVISDLFVERTKPTSIAGKSYDDDQARAIWKDWESSLDTPDYRVEDGENYEDMIVRADKALSYLEERSESSFVVVSHGHFIRTVFARIMLGDGLNSTALRKFYERATLENTSITAFRYKEAYEEEFCWRLWAFNDHAHFAE
jgi:2,3-bisphosphoglycerate-dependent phosphoglycerate mutase